MKLIRPSRRFLCRLGHAALLNGVIAATAFAQAPAKVDVEAWAGEPFGVGKMTVNFELARGPKLPPDQMLWLAEKEGRALYPVSLTGGSLHLQIPGTLPAGTVGRVTVYFLFRGKQPLQLTYDVAESHRADVVPQSDPAAHKRLLDEWWLHYSGAAVRLTQADVAPPQIENYLTAMLARRLDLKPPEFKRPFTGQQDIDFMFGTLAGSESVRLAMQKDTVLRRGDKPQVADRPLPTPVVPPRLEVPAVPGDVAIEPLALHVPAECFYLRCGSYRNFRWFRETVEQWGGDLRNLVAVRGLDYQLGERVERELALRETALSKLLGDAVIADMAVIGTDTFLREGAAIGVLFQAKSNVALAAAIAAQRAAALPGEKQATEEMVDVGGHKVALLSTPDNTVRSFYAVDGDFHLVTTSQTIVRRFFEAGAGQEALGGLPEFRYARTLMPLARNDTLFVYLSDAFFRLLVGPQYRVEMTRRMQADAEIELVHLARLAAKAEQQPADTIEQLIAGGFLPPQFAQRSDGTRTTERDGVVVDSLRGARGAFLPVPDVEITGITPSEVEAYQEFARLYSRQWQRVDPVTVGIRREMLKKGAENGERERVVFDVHIAPYARQHYGFFAAWLSPPDKQRIAPVPDNLLEAEVLLGQTPSQKTDANYRMFAGLRDFVPAFVVREGQVIIDYSQERQLPYYLGETPRAAFFAGTVANNTSPSPDGYAELERKSTWFRWRRQFDDFWVMANAKPLLEAVTPHVKLEPAARPAQLRVRVADLASAQVSRLLQAQNYVRARSTSASNVYFLHALMQQLHVEAAKAPAAMEQVLAAKPVCSLGKYELMEFGPGPVRWHSTAWPVEYLSRVDRVPEGYRSPFLDWLRGLDLEFTIDRTTLTTHIELELQPR